MNRNEEYKKLLSELDDTPPALDDVVNHAKSRAKKSIYIHNFFAIPASCILFFLIAFIGMVNGSTTFAMACGKIPLLRELAAAVAFSPSLTAAVDNEYVQPMGLEQSENDITMHVEYVIVDQKQLDIFYSLQSKRYTKMDATPSIRNPDGTSMEGYSISSGGYGPSNGDLRQFTVDFMERDMPRSLILQCEVHDNGSDEISAPVSTDTDQTEAYKAPDVLATLTFTLNFDPQYTHEGEMITLNQWFVLDEQRLEVTTIEIYPTHIRLNLGDDENNTAWLQSLTFYLENEKGERFEAISNGITATGTLDSPMMSSHRLESSFFSKSKKFTLYITDVVWLDKNMERVKIDLANERTDTLPEGVKLEEAIRKGSNWYLIFSAIQKKENTSYQLFGQNYYDQSGKKYEINSWSSGMTGFFDETTQQYIETPKRFNEQFSLKNYPYDTVYLSPSFSRFVHLAAPIEIQVK